MAAEPGDSARNNRALNGVFHEGEEVISRPEILAENECAT
jgi:hypothetical protein